jgi:hypothetical protein
VFNPYTIILGLFTLTGLLATVWGYVIIARARQTLRWPHVEGIIEESNLSSAKDDLLPHIVFRYTVAEQTYRQPMEFAGDITPSQEFAKSYVEKYPVGRKTQVYYQPDNPRRATLEPGLGRGDWLVFAIGLGSLIFGVVLLLLGG